MNQPNNYLYKCVTKKKFLNQDECEAARKVTGRGLGPCFQTNINNPGQRETLVSFIDSGLEWLSDKVMVAINEINEQVYHFEIRELSPFNLIKYPVGSHYDCHTDLGGFKQAYRKLGCILLLSQPTVEFEGGRLEFKGLSVTPALEQGTLAVFPAYIPHEIHPVTQGTRYSLVAFARGPTFK